MYYIILYMLFESWYHLLLLLDYCLHLLKLKISFGLKHSHLRYFWEKDKKTIKMKLIFSASDILYIIIATGWLLVLLTKNSSIKNNILTCTAVAACIVLLKDNFNIEILFTVSQYKVKPTCHFSCQAVFCQPAHITSLKINDLLYGQLTKWKAACCSFVSLSEYIGRLHFTLWARHKSFRATVKFKHSLYVAQSIHTADLWRLRWTF